MAVFPTSPSVGTTTVINGMTYAYNSQGAWEIALTQSDESLVDVGVSTFESQVFDSPPVVLLHFDDNWNNTGSGGNATAVGPPTFQTSTVTGTGFSKQIDFDNTAGTSSTAAEYVTIPDPGIGTGAFTFECFFSSDVATDGQMIFSEGGSTGNGSAYGDLNFELVNRADYTNGKNGIVQWQAHASGQWKYTWWGTTATGHLWTAGGGMQHVALVRGASSGGNSQWSLYLNGQYIAPNTLHNTDNGLLPTVDMGGQAHQLGRVALGGYAFNGKLDEVRITKSAVYSGTGSYPIPSGPFTLGNPPPSGIAGKALLYAKDSAGDPDTPEVLYHFNDNLTDDGVNSTTTTSANLTYASGKFGNAADFNGSTTAGSNSYIEFTGAGNDIGTGSYTIEFWLYLDSLDVAGRGAILDSHSGQSAETAGFFNIKLYSSRLYVSHYDGTTWTQPWSTHGLSYNFWYHIAVCRDTVGTTRFFRSGSLMSNGTHTNTAGKSIGDGGHPWTIGRYMSDTFYPAYNLNGRIDELLITKTAKYTSAFVAPIAPYLGAPISKLHVMDSTGSEGVIS